MNPITTRSKREYPDTNQPPVNESETARVESVALQALGSNNNNDSGTPSASKKRKIVVEIFDMPKETIFEILRYLPAKDLIRFSQTSRTARIVARDFLSLIHDFTHMLSISKPEKAANNQPDNYHLQFGSLIRLLDRSRGELVQMMQRLPDLLEIKTKPEENRYIRNSHSLLVRAIFGTDHKIDEKSMPSDQLTIFLTRLLELVTRAPVVSEVDQKGDLLVYIENNYRLIFKYVEQNKIPLLINYFINAEKKYPVSELVKDCETFERRLIFLQALWNHQIISNNEKCTFTDSNGVLTEIIRFQGAFYTTVGLLNGTGCLKDVQGNVFKGGFRDGKPDGNVSITDIQNNEFDGVYKEGFPYEGKGVVRNDDGHIFEFVPSSGNKWSQVRKILFYPDNHSWRAPEGEEEYKDIDTLGTLGTFLYGNGNTYEGELKNFRPNGKGKRTSTNDQFVEGEFENTVFLQGHGSFHINGDRYVGNLKGTMKHGQGTLKYANGRVYIGEFKNNQRCGHGILRLPPGDIYEGEFQNDKMHGHGTYKWTNGRVYIGEFENNQRSGYGTVTFPNGSFYEGEFKFDKAHGQGTTHSLEGIVFKGCFLDGKQNGPGSLSFPDGYKYEGTWTDGKKNGPFKRTSPDGELSEVVYQDDNPFDGVFRN